MAFRRSGVRFPSAPPNPCRSSWCVSSRSRRTAGLDARAAARLRRIREQGAGPSGLTRPARAGQPASREAVLANHAGGMADMISTGEQPLRGKISAKGSIVAWIALGDLPTKLNRIFSIAGKSADGDDIGLHIQGADQHSVCTGGGGSTGDPTGFTTAAIGMWRLIAASFEAGGNRTMYIDGRTVAKPGTGGHGMNQSPFYLGESPVFKGQCLVGSVADVAVFKTFLPRDDAKRLCASSPLRALPLRNPLCIQCRPVSLS